MKKDNPSIKELKLLKDSAIEYAKKIKNKEVLVNIGNEKIKDKLNAVKDVIIALENENYKTILYVLEKKLNFFISEQTLRKYCRDNLGWEKRKKNNNIIILKKDNNCDISKMLKKPETFS